MTNSSTTCSSSPSSEEMKSNDFSSSSTSHKNREGINIHDAMAILAGRSTQGNELQQMQKSGEADRVTDEKKRMGQEIELFGESQEWTKPDALKACPACEERNQNGDAHSEATGSSRISSQLEQTQSELASKTERHRLQMRDELSNATHKELLQLIMKIQNDRVSTYKIFDQALQAVIQSGGNVSAYPAAVAEATASFSVLSNTMNAILDVLILRKQQEVMQSESSKDKVRHHLNDCTGWIKTLQHNEKEKLNLTAALHLEKIRQVNSTQSELEHDGGRLSSSILLQQGVESLQKQLIPKIEEINDVLEEIRYAIAESEPT